jgi:putative FmdB family regulatory protein
MPIYEFYCPDCHTIFNFFARRVNTAKRPDCPKCGRSDLERKASAFAISTGRSEAVDDPLSGGDEARFEQAMAAMASEAEGLDTEDPRQAARMMRKLCEATGMPVGAGMEEAIRRMEAGEDPDAIEERLGPLLDDEDPFGGETGSARLKSLRKKLPPSVDTTLHEL